MGTTLLRPLTATEFQSLTEERYELGQGKLGL